MSQSPSNLAGNCPGCGVVNAAGMAFCVNCGYALAAGSPPTQPSQHRAAVFCQSCGQRDDMSHTFCVHCGASMTDPTKRETAEQPAVATMPVAKPVAKQTKPAPKPPPNLTAPAIIAGIACGVALAFLANGAGLLNLFAQNNLPRQGLVLYATPAEAKVTIQERSGKSFTVGRTGKTGALSIPDLPAGAYRLTLSAPGRLPVVKDIQIDGNKAVVLGFPKRIELPSER